MDLAEFVKARLDEDAAAAIDAGGGRWEAKDGHVRYAGSPPSANAVAPWTYEYAPHIARHDPARVLREVKAKRAILADHEPVRHEGRMMCATCLGGYTFWPCPTLLALAAVWRDHPDYDPAWSPS
jgi:hypothetical protein